MTSYKKENEFNFAARFIEMEADTPLPKINMRAPPDIHPPKLPVPKLRKNVEVPKPKSMPVHLKTAAGPIPKTHPTFGYTKAIQATHDYKMAPKEYRD
jgi:hypothetical protein